MKITLICVGKTDNDYTSEGVNIYINRLKHYYKTEIEIIPDLKKASKISNEERKKKEGEAILKKIEPSDIVILLDEKGKEYTSRQFATQIEKHAVSGIKNLIFVIGGAFGFSDDVYQRANSKLSLSKMTFSHQMIRVFFLEQIYRACTILNNEPYHND